MLKAGETMMQQQEGGEEEAGEKMEKIRHQGCLQNMINHVRIIGSWFPVPCAWVLVVGIWFLFSWSRVPGS
jgi:hypothetical protein